MREIPIIIATKLCMIMSLLISLVVIVLNMKINNPAPISIPPRVGMTPNIPVGAGGENPRTVAETSIPASGDAEAIEIILRKTSIAIGRINFFLISTTFAGILIDFKS